MIPEIESFGHLMIARRAGGEPVGLVRSPDEVVFLAFDASIKRLVELHILRSGRTLDSVAKKSAFERAKQASEVRGPTFMRILEVGEDQGLVYYTSNLNDGEFIEDYIQRRGPLLPAIVFSLVFQMLDDLIQLKDYQRLVAQMRLDRVVMTTLEDTFLHLRIYDYGLSANESEEAPRARLVIQVCQLMFLMLTGKKHAGDNPDRYPSLTALPMSLRMAMRAALTDPEHCPSSLERLRDDVREAIGALVSGIQARNTRKQLVVIAALQPRSALQDLLLENVPVEIILGNRFRVEGENDARRYPFSIPCFNTKNDQPVTVHLLPPSRIVDKTQYEAVPLQMWRFNADKHPNILRSLSLWESPDWTFLTEEREPGFALSRLLAERITLNPQEVAILLRQVQAGQEQALECGVQRLDLHPSNILLRVGKNGPTANREHERLMQKRLDAWPPFQVKLRAHLTMRNLYEPPLVDKPEHGEHGEAHLADRDYRHRSFVALAAYLLTGQRQTGGMPRFPDATPEPLAEFIRECLEKSRDHGQTPTPLDFLLQFEGLMNGTQVRGSDLASRLKGTAVPIEEMESVGSVSDFEDDWDGGGDLPEHAPSAPIARQLRAVDFSKRRSQGTTGIICSGAALVVFGLLGWWLFKGGETPPLRSSMPAAIGDAPSPAPQPAAIPPAEREKKVIATQAEAKAEPARAVIAEPIPTPMAPPQVETPPAAKPVVAVAPEPTKPKVEATATPPPPAPMKAEATVTGVGPAPTTKSSVKASEDPPLPPSGGLAPSVTASMPTIPVNKPTPPAAAPAPTATPALPPARQPVPNSEIIRKAIVPSAEEIARFKQGQVKPPQQLPAQVQPKPVDPQEPPLRSGAMPTLNVAQPLPDEPKTRQ
ncbi:hypothetical protein SAMN02745166_00042 [Prosthecobacter debontii]|uniref:Protein kinase domain-containing protein n=1 Tax=Prosthecobacter debontii TaxID=48467 RepID=A0A1T4WEC7_9BACT|nr:hypothetical protein [Prosthecobacter debontii]SKA75547.1 hypothetical protein SAMN02745166_00042 [Prosthecobacter debontii]